MRYGWREACGTGVLSSGEITGVEIRPKQTHANILAARTTTEDRRGMTRRTPMRGSGSNAWYSNAYHPAAHTYHMYSNAWYSNDPAARIGVPRTAMIRQHAFDEPGPRPRPRHVYEPFGRIIAVRQPRAYLDVSERAARACRKCRPANGAGQWPASEARTAGARRADTDALVARRRKRPAAPRHRTAPPVRVSAQRAAGCVAARSSLPRLDSVAPH